MSVNQFGIVPCKSWDDFIGQIREASPLQRTAIYRGLEDPDFELSSMWERCRKGQTGPTFTITESGSVDIKTFPLIGFLTPFKELVRSLPGVDLTSLKDDEDWWALGRHYGLITPYLDWTFSPYIAAFFACWSRVKKCNPHFDTGILFYGQNFNESYQIVFGEKPIAIWQILLDPNLPVPAEFEIIRPKLSFSPVNARIHAQQGVFTHLNSDDYTDVAAYLIKKNMGFHLIRFEIPSQEIFKALGDLERMGITYSKLFPDPAGAALQLNTAALRKVLSRWGPVSES